MKSLTYLAVFLLTSFSVNAKGTSLDIAGVWHTGNNNSLVKIATNEGLMVGRLIKSDKAKVGTLILSELKQQKSYWLAKVYSIKRDQFFPAKVTRKDNKLLLKVDAGFFTKEIEWQLHE